MDSHLPRQEKCPGTELIEHGIEYRCVHPSNFADITHPQTRETRRYGIHAGPLKTCTGLLISDSDERYASVKDVAAWYHDTILPNAAPLSPPPLPPAAPIAVVAPDPTHPAATNRATFRGQPQCEPGQGWCESCGKSSGFLPRNQLRSVHSASAKGYAIQCCKCTGQATIMIEYTKSGVAPSAHRRKDDESDSE